MCRVPVTRWSPLSCCRAPVAAAHRRHPDRQRRLVRPIVTLDGSSTVFPISEAVAEEFQKADERHVRVTVGHLRHRRRLPEVLPRRDRHQRRVAADQRSRDRGLPGRRHQLHRAAHRLRRHRDRRQSEGHVDQRHHGRRAEDALGARGAGQGDALEPGAAGWPDREIHLFGAGVDSGTYDYFTEAINGKARRQPRRLHVERGRQRAGAGRLRRRSSRSASFRSPTTTRTRAG